MTGNSDAAWSLPVPLLRPYIASYSGYRAPGVPGATHVGMPGSYLTVIITIDEPLQMLAMTNPQQPPGTWHTLASGLAAVPCTISMANLQYGIQLAFTPLGARALFGMPTAELGTWIVGLDDVIGLDAEELRTRIAVAPSWRSRFAILNEVFGRRVREVPTDANLQAAWDLLVGSGGRRRVGEVAVEIGWSRRHLVNKFTAEYGVTPKDAARIARFERSHRILRRERIPPLADVAASCGFYDQAHMAREWRDLAGMAPSHWRAAELFTFVQADDTDAAQP